MTLHSSFHSAHTLGVLLIVAGCAYLGASFTSLVPPRNANAVSPFSNPMIDI
jgi:hypothetical protein